MNELIKMLLANSKKVYDNPIVRSIAGPFVGGVAGELAGDFSHPMQRWLQENVDPEGKYATHFATERARMAAQAPYLYATGVPLVPIGPQSIPIPPNEDRFLFAGGKPASGDTKRALDEVAAQNVHARNRYNYANESWRFLENMVQEQNANMFSEMQKYRENYKRRHGVEPSLDQKRIKMREIRAMQNNPGDVLRGQYSAGSTALQKAGRDKRTTGSGNAAVESFDRSELPWLLQQGLPGGEVKPNTLFLPNMDRIRPYVIPR